MRILRIFKLVRHFAGQAQTFPTMNVIWIYMIIMLPVKKSTFDQWSSPWLSTFVGLQSLFYTLQQAYQVSWDSNLSLKLLILWPGAWSLAGFSSRSHYCDDHYWSPLITFDRYNDQELGLLLVLVAVAILTYSSLVYFAEREGQVVTIKRHLRWM